MFISTLEAKEVARQIESDDLPTPVTQDFAGADRSANDFVNAFNWVILVKNSCFGCEGYTHPDAADQQVERFGVSARD
jgi:hypothetical protein